MVTLRTTSCLLLLSTLYLAGCKPASRTPERRPAIARDSGTPTAPAAARPRIKPTQMQAIPGTPKLILLGTWQTLAGTEFDVGFYGTEAGFVAGASMAGAECVYQTQLSTQTMRLFRCIGPSLDDASENKSEPLRVTYNNGALPTNAGPFYFRNTATWKYYNGDFYFESVWQYLVNASATSGPTIVLQARTLPGYVGDPTFSDHAAYFNAIRLSGSSMTVTCPTVGIYEYKCPAIPEGTYAVEILHDQSRRYVVDNTFFIKVIFGPADPPAPTPGTTPSPEDPTTTPAPHCDPSAVKGC